MDNKKIKIEFLGKILEFENREELKKEFNNAIKFFKKNSTEYTQLKMIQLQYNL